MARRQATRVGHFGDVLKHVIMCEMFPVLNRASRPWTYVDFYAGRGAWEHGSSAAQAIQLPSNSGHKHVLKYVHRFENYLKSKNAKPKSLNLFSRYNKVLRDFARENGDWDDSKSAHANDLAAQYYPGTPMFAHWYMRPQDRAILIEHDKHDFDELTKRLGGDRRFKLFNGQPADLLNAAVPPRTANGLAYFDCGPDATLNEVNEMGKLVEQTCDKWPNATKVITYPIPAKLEGDQSPSDYPASRPLDMLRGIIKTGQTKVLNAELYIDSGNEHQHLGVGVCMVNPPDQFDKLLNNNVLPSLMNVMQPTPPVFKTRKARAAWLTQRSVLDEPESDDSTKLSWDWHVPTVVEVNSKMVPYLQMDEKREKQLQNQPLHPWVLEDEEKHDIENKKWQDRLETPFNQPEEWMEEIWASQTKKLVIDVPEDMPMSEQAELYHQQLETLDEQDEKHKFILQDKEQA